MYFDVTSPHRYANHHHGCGYPRPDSSGALALRDVRGCEQEPLSG